MSILVEGLGPRGVMLGMENKSKKLIEDMEALASRLSDLNYVEAAWALRGLTDALDGQAPAHEPVYGKYYRKGYNSIG